MYPRLIAVLALLAGSILAPAAALAAPPARAATSPARAAAGSAPPAGSPFGALAWSDEFNAGTAPAASKWQVITGGGGFGNAELQYYTARRANVAVSHGNLVLTARRGRYTGPDHVSRDWTSGAVQTKTLYNAIYGEIDARIKIPAGQGLWPAFWMVGSNVDQVGWPGSGEIDMMENVGSNPYGIFSSIHGPQTGTTHGYGLTAHYTSPTSLAAGYHVYGVRWRPGQITFTIDGTPFSTRTAASLPAGASWVFDHPFFIILDLAVGGTSPGPPATATHFPAAMDVDWVRVYQ